LAARGDQVVALIRDPERAAHLKRDNVSIVVSDLSSVPQLTAQMSGADAIVHAAGMYEVGIKKSQHERMWDANVGATRRVLDAAIEAQVPRIVYVRQSELSVTPTATRSTRRTGVTWRKVS
jgi:dihydroflavonol-4-reductase